MNIDSYNDVLDLDLDSETIEKLNHISNATGQSVDVIVSDLVEEYNKRFLSDMKTIVCNDFSLNMLQENCNLNIRLISPVEFSNILKNNNFECSIGDKKIAEYFGLPYAPKDISLNKYTRLIVAKPINNVSTTKVSDLQFKYYELKYDGMWNYDWINKH